MRVINHLILPPIEQKPIEFFFEGKKYDALEGDSIASALLANGIRTIRYSEKNNDPRGLYCGIGHCYECRIHLEGSGKIRACITPVTEGMRLSPSEIRRYEDER